MSPIDPVDRVLDRAFGHDDRAVSTTVSYALNLSVATILMTSLLVASAGFVDDQRERAIRTELPVLGGQLADDVSTADRLANTPGTDSVVITSDLPQEVAGRTYEITVRGGTDPHLLLSTTDPTVVVGVNLTLLEGSPASIPAGETSLSGGTVEIEYDGSTGILEITENTDG